MGREGTSRGVSNNRKGSSKRYAFVCKGRGGWLRGAEPREWVLMARSA